MVDGVKSLAKDKVNDMHCSSFIYRSSYCITEGNQVGEARFTLGKCMLAVPSHLLLPVPRKVFQEDRITESQNGRGWKGPLWVI